MRADRLLSILLLLQGNGRMTAQALAKRLEVCERTILRDMDALGAAGIPIVAERGARGGWRLMDGYQTKLTGLTSSEIQSLFLGRPPKLLADLGLKDAADAAWIKLQAALPREFRAQAEFVRQRILIDPRGWRDSAESISMLPVLMETLWSGQRLRFSYERSVYQDGPSLSNERVVDPLGLVARGSVWYLVAARDGALRTYRVSRIRDAAALPEAAARPPGFDLATHWENAATEFREKLPRYDATFVVAAHVMPWIRYRGGRVQEESRDGDRVRMRVRFDIEQEAVQFALAFGTAVRIVEPHALRDRVRDAAREIVDAYSAEEATASPATSARADARPSH